MVDGGTVSKTGAGGRQTGKELQYTVALVDSKAKGLALVSAGRDRVKINC